ncbi:MAG: hypothetical protein ABI977_11840 [Acidobacteriota bacterium]
MHCLLRPQNDGPASVRIGKWSDFTLLLPLAASFVPIRVVEMNFIPDVFFRILWRGQYSANLARSENGQENFKAKRDNVGRRRLEYQLHLAAVAFSQPVAREPLPPEGGTLYTVNKRLVINSCRFIFQHSAKPQ